LDALKRSDLTVEKQTTLIRQSSNEIRRLQTLTDNILLASQLDQHESARTQQVIELSKVLMEECKRFQLYSGRNIVMNIGNDIQINADQEMTRALISNLLDNAIKYSPNESAIQVSLIPESHHYQLRIADEGAGISESEKTRIFERFYRSNDEITRSTSGTGLGLYIVKTICQLHQYKIRVENNLPEGTIFIIQFAA
ncbi:MAG: sensor histidine kinase, partial [Flavobacteriales bacterium]